VEPTLVVLPEPVAVDPAEDYKIIAGLTTYGEARAANLIASVYAGS
jgi:hypothetical protein